MLEPELEVEMEMELELEAGAETETGAEAETGAGAGAEMKRHVSLNGYFVTFRVMRANSYLFYIERLCKKEENRESCITLEI